MILKNLFSISFSLFVFLILASCDGDKTSTTDKNSKLSAAQGTNNVDIIIQPRGEKPLISLGSGGTKICRRGEIPVDTVYGLVKNELSVAAAAVTTPTPAAAGAAGGAAGTSTAVVAATAGGNSLLKTTSVGDNWFKIGLLIVNKRTDFWLIIEKLDFVITTRWGNELLKGTTEISSGYCESEHLYIVSPTPKGRGNKSAYSGNLYQPFKASTKGSFVNNLTLYVSGVPVPTTAVNQKNKTPNSNTEEDKFVLSYLPPYRVKMYVSGRWIDKKRNDKGGFVKTVRFALSSRFYN